MLNFTPKGWRHIQGIYTNNVHKSNSQGQPLGVRPNGFVSEQIINMCVSGCILFFCTIPKHRPRSKSLFPLHTYIGVYLQLIIYSQNVLLFVNDMKICKNKYFNYWQKKHLTLHVIELASVYTHRGRCLEIVQTKRMQPDTHILTHCSFTNPLGRTPR
jgi:hypothetical protein